MRFTLHIADVCIPCQYIVFVGIHVLEVALHNTLPYFSTFGLNIGPIDEAPPVCPVRLNKWC